MLPTVGRNLSTAWGGLVLYAVDRYASVAQQL